MREGVRGVDPQPVKNPSTGTCYLCLKNKGVDKWLTQEQKLKEFEQNPDSSPGSFGFTYCDI